MQKRKWSSFSDEKNFHVGRSVGPVYQLPVLAVHKQHTVVAQPPVIKFGKNPLRLSLSLLRCWLTYKMMAHILGGHFPSGLWMDPFPPYYQPSRKLENKRHGRWGGLSNCRCVLKQVPTTLSLSLTRTNQRTNDSIWNGVDGFRLLPLEKSRPPLRSTQGELEEEEKMCWWIKRTLRLLMSRTVSAVFSFIHSGPEGRNIPDKIRHRIVFFFF